MEQTLTCPECHNKFSPTVAWQDCCTPKCTNRRRQRRYRAKHRKGGGGGGGNGGGGGDAPMLSEELNLDPKTIAVTLPDASYRTPAESERKPSSTEKSLKAVA